MQGLLGRYKKNTLRELCVCLKVQLVYKEVFCRFTVLARYIFSVVFFLVEGVPPIEENKNVWFA